jgi:hypothetical protein
MSNLTSVKKRLGLTAEPDVTASSASGSGAGEDAINGLTDTLFIFEKTAADGMAGTATANTKFASNGFEFDMEIVGFWISPTGTLTADAANFATIQILTDDAADGAPAVAMSLATTIAAPGSGNWATDILQNVTIPTINAATKGTQTAANRRLRSGANLFIAITKSGTGVVVPISEIVVRCRRV